MKHSQKILIDRFLEVYAFLLDETENPDTIYDKQRNQRMSDLLELLEYLQGEDEENPLLRWFPDPAGHEG